MKKILVTGLVAAVLLLLIPGAIGCGAPYELSPLEVSPAVCLAGDGVTVSTTVDYRGSEKFGYVADLLVDGVVEQTNTFTFEPDSSQSVSFTVAKDEPGLYEVQLGEQAASFVVLGVSNFGVSPDTVNQGQPVTVTADLQNVTGAPVTYCCCLECNGQEVETRDITIAGNATETVSFSLSKDTGGRYGVELLGESASFTVKKPAEFKITELNVLPNPVKAGSAAMVAAKVSNVGDIAGTYDFKLLVDGAVYHTASVELSGHGVETVTVDVTKDSAGSYTVAVGDKQATLNVIEPVTRESSVLYRDMSGYNGLKVNNYLDYDIVVILCDVDEPLTPLLAYYVQSGDNISSKNVEVGAYYLYITTGWGWDEASSRFLVDANYYRYKGELEWERITMTVTTWNINVEQANLMFNYNKLSEGEFPKLP